MRDGDNIRMRDGDNVRMRDGICIGMETVLDWGQY